MDIAPIMDMVWLAVVGSILASLVPIVVIILVVVWAIRRNARPAEDPALVELKRRLAAGEISPVEFQVLRRALEEDA